jgi:hypothetical protein
LSRAVLRFSALGFSAPAGTATTVRLRMNGHPVAEIPLLWEGRPQNIVHPLNIETMRKLLAGSEIEVNADLPEGAPFSFQSLSLALFARA